MYLAAFYERHTLQSLPRWSILRESIQLELLELHARVGQSNRRGLSMPRVSSRKIHYRCGPDRVQQLPQGPCEVSGVLLLSSRKMELCMWQREASEQ